MNSIEKRKVHVIAHTHWDREWYLPHAVFSYRFSNLMNSLISIISDDPDFRFLLDGQTLCIEDYLEIYPEMQSTIKRYCSSGQLEIGPFYGQIDQFMGTGGEVGFLINAKSPCSVVGY